MRLPTYCKPQLQDGQRRVFCSDALDSGSSAGARHSFRRTLKIPAYSMLQTEAILYSCIASAFQTMSLQFKSSSRLTTHFVSRFATGTMSATDVVRPLTNVLRDEAWYGMAWIPTQTEQVVVVGLGSQCGTWDHRTPLRSEVLSSTRPFGTGLSQPHTSSVALPTSAVDGQVGGPAVVTCWRVCGDNSRPSLPSLSLMSTSLLISSDLAWH